MNGDNIEDNSKGSHVDNSKAITPGKSTGSTSDKAKASTPVSPKVTVAAKPKPVDAMVKVSKGLPVVNAVSEERIVAHSDLLLLRLNDGRVIPGYYIRYERDYDRPHVKIEKGTCFFIGPDDNEVKGVDAWSTYGKVNI